MLLAGVLKFNTSLKSLEVRAMDLDDDAATNFYLALKENTSLEHFDISDNLVGPLGVSKIAEAVRSHPALATFKVDGSALPVPQVRGARKTDTKIDVGDWGLGPLSGYAIGAIAMESQTLTEIDLRANGLGADGAAAVINGLGEAPIKTLDVTRNALGAPVDPAAFRLVAAGRTGSSTTGTGATTAAATAASATATAATDAPADGDEEGAPTEQVDVPPIQMLSVAICQNLRSLQELRLDENDLDCDAEELSALCKLRSLRTFTADKNRLTALPSLLGTMTSLRKISLHSNNLTELPTSICLLVALEALDLHKNLIRSLPPSIGGLRALQRLDLSENKLTELPSTVCELSDTLQLSVGRNPLEKPSIEQARQGVGAIRRYFGFSRAREPDAPAGGAAGEVKKDKKDKDKEEMIPDQTQTEVDPRRPVGRLPGAPSRHDWAGDAGVILLFNCANASYTVAEGGVDLESYPPDEQCDLVAPFNMQVVGRVRLAKKTPGGWEPFASRIEWRNFWLPWRVSEQEYGEPPILPLPLKSSQWGKQSATLNVTVWLSYGCSIGARFLFRRADPYIADKRSVCYATCSFIKPDDTIEILIDNEVPSVLLGPDVIDPRPDTVSRTQTPAYKQGQKLLIMHEGQPHDAVVEEWLGMRRGSRHKVRLGGRRATRPRRPRTPS